MKIAAESVVSVLLCDLRRKVGDIVNSRQVRIRTGDHRARNRRARFDSKTDFGHKLSDPNEFDRRKCDGNKFGFVSGLCSDSLKFRTPADQTEIHEETIARNRFPLLVTDVSKVSVVKADSWVGLLAIRTSAEEDRSVLRCDSPKVRLDVTPRSEITKLIDERTSVSKKPHGQE